MLAWTPPPRFANTAHSAPSLSPSAAGIRYVAARICLGGPSFHRAGMVHLTGTEAAPAPGAADCSGWTSFGGAAQAEKIASVEREIIETQLKIRALFKFLLLLVDYQICGEKRNAISTSRFLHRPEKSHNCSSESPWVRIASSVQSRRK